VPNYQTTAPQEKTLNNVRTTNLSVSSPPFGLVYSLHKNVAFVALNQSLGVLNTTTFTPRLLHEIPFPAAYFIPTGAAGITLTHDGRHVLVSLGRGAIVIDVARAVKGSSDAVVGALNGTAGIGAIEVITTLDDKYAFVSQEYGTTLGNRGNIEVFRLHKPGANGSMSSAYIGNLTLDELVVGTALSPNGSILYATSEQSNGTKQGTLSIIDVEILKKTPSNALLSKATAGCGAVRVAVSPDGKTVWVTARESNHLLAFDAAKLITNSSDALLASVQVGTSPVGLIFAQNWSRILTADSNRFGYTNTTTGLSVVDVRAALDGEEAVLGQIPTGLFPREFAISPDGRTILVSDYGSKGIQAVNVATLP
jgi:hypothetical protein